MIKNKIKKRCSKNKKMDLCDMACEALKKAVRGVIEDHKRTGRPLAVWRNGKVVLISPYTLK